MENNISAFPKPENRPVTLKDLKITVPSVGLTVPLIMDGSIIEPNLKHINKNRTWLIEELNKQGISNYEQEVQIAEVDSNLEISVLKR